MKAIIQQNLPYVINPFHPIDPAQFPKTAEMIRTALDAPGLAHPGQNFPTLLLAPLARAFEYDKRDSIVVRRSGLDCSIEFYNQLFKGKPCQTDHFLSVSITRVEPEWFKRYTTRLGNTWQSFYNATIEDDKFNLRTVSRYCRPVNELVDLLDALIEDEDNLRDDEGNDIETPDLRFMGTVHQVQDDDGDGHARVLIHRLYTLNGIWVSITLSHAVTDTDPLAGMLRDLLISGDDPALASDYGLSFDFDASVRLSLRAYSRTKGLQHIWPHSHADYQLDSLPPTMLPAFIPPFNEERVIEDMTVGHNTMHHWLGEFLKAKQAKLLAHYGPNDDAYETFYFAAPGGLFRLMSQPS